MPYFTMLRTATPNLLLDSKNAQNLLSVKILSCSWMFYISTCKLSVQRAPCPKPGDQLPVGLEDEDAACLVIDSDDVTVTIHRDAFRPHQSPSTDFILSRKAGGGKSCNEMKLYRKLSFSATVTVFLATVSVRKEVWYGVCSRSAYNKRSVISCSKDILAFKRNRACTWGWRGSDKSSSSHNQLDWVNLLAL